MFCTTMPQWHQVPSHPCAFYHAARGRGSRAHCADSAVSAFALQLMWLVKSAGQTVEDGFPPPGQSQPWGEGVLSDPPGGGGED